MKRCLVVLFANLILLVASRSQAEIIMPITQHTAAQASVGNLSASGQPHGHESSTPRTLDVNHGVPINAQSITDKLALGKSLHYFADRNTQLTIQDIIQKHAKLKWQRSKQATPTFGFTDSTYWFYVDVRNPSPVSLTKILQVANPLLDDIRLYVTAGTRVLDAYNAGLKFPFAQRPINEHDFAFPINIAPHEWVRLYISVHTRSDGVRMPVFLWGVKQLQSAIQTDYIVNGMYFGLLLGLALYNLFLFFVVKDAAYLYYSLFQFTFTIFQLAVNGYGYQFLWPEQVGLNTLLTYIFACIPGAFLSLFSYKILSIKGSSRVINKSWLVLTGVFATGFLLTPLITNKLYIGMIALNPVVLLMAVLFAVTSVRYWKLDRVARIWTVALLIFIGGAALYVLPAAGLIESNTFLKYTVQMGSALEAVMLSLLLGYRIRQEQNEKIELFVESEEIRQAAIAKSRFLAAASHDLRQPLHALSLFVDVVKEEKVEEQRKNLFSRIDASLDALRKMFDALLDISRLDANAVMPEYSHFDIAELLKSLAAEFRAEASNKGLALRVRASACVVVSDRLLLERILRNLIGNAIRYTESGGVLLSVRQRDNAVLLQVWDTGVGIPREQQDEVFIEFHQLHNTHHARNQGLGLGLAIVKRLCILLNHPLVLSSQPGEGSVFSVLAPKGSQRQIVVKEMAVSAYNRELSGHNIVVIDDERQILDAMQALLLKWGCEVIVAESLADAETQLKARQMCPDLILSDLRLHDNNTGVEAIDYLRAKYGSSIPGILITGENVLEQEIMTNGCYYKVLQKPVQPIRLRSVIHQHLLDSMESA